MLAEIEWNTVARLGTGAFEAISGSVVNIMLGLFTSRFPHSNHSTTAIDASFATYDTKALSLIHEPLIYINQESQSRNKNSVFVFGSSSNGALLSNYVEVHYGSKPGQTIRVTRQFWEVPFISPDMWMLMASSPSGRSDYSGKTEICYSLSAIDRFGISEFGIRGRDAWGKRGIVISRMNNLPASLYRGEFFDDNAYVLIPKVQDLLVPIFSFVKSGDYRLEVRNRNQKLGIDTDTMISVPFDLDHWQQVAAEQYPDGLPEPHSDDPTQWLFEGHPKESDAPLQVAVARLLGYRWPEQPETDGLEPLADADGLVGLPAIGGERPAAERLRALLAAAWGAEWSPAVEARLLAEAGFANKTLEEWLRDGFFEQHVKLFHNRPFIWQIWDGRKDGFSVLVNYHKLTGTLLDNLMYTTLGRWVEQQRGLREAGDAAAEARISTALALEAKLKAIREGEAPYDIYVRWKSLAQQPIGWDPDLNDGVRLNIRPWIEPWGRPSNSPLRAKVNVKWGVDRGTNPDGSNRDNDKHYTLEQKRTAR